MHELYKPGDVVHVEGASAIIGDVLTAETIDDPHGDGWQEVTVSWRPTVTTEQSFDLIRDNPEELPGRPIACYLTPDQLANVQTAIEHFLGYLDDHGEKDYDPADDVAEIRASYLAAAAAIDHAGMLALTTSSEETTCA